MPQRGCTLKLVVICFQISIFEPLETTELCNVCNELQL